MNGSSHSETDGREFQRLNVLRDRRLSRAADLGVAQSPILGGSSDSSDRAIVSLVIADGDELSTCTGALVGSTSTPWILSAAHCVFDPSSGAAVEPSRVTDGVRIPVAASGMTLLTTLGTEPVSGTLVASSRVAYADDFESGNLDDWQLSGGTWTIATDRSRVLELSSGTADCMATRGGALADFTLEAKVNIHAENGNAGLVLRASGSNDFYTFRINASTKQAELYKKVAGTMTLVAASSSISVETDRWYALKVTVMGNRIKTYLDGYPISDWTNGTSELESGNVGVRATSSSSYDDVIVTQ